jgi:hypothetical protein
MRMLRYRIGRAVLHAGLRILPAGRVRTELTILIQHWARNVYAALRSQP